MVSGLPDYLKDVRYRFGGAKMVGGQKSVDVNKITDLVDVIGKGIVYGGVLWLDHTSTQANSVPLLVVDKSTLNDLSFIRLNSYGIDRARTMPLSLNFYDSVNFIYSVGVSYGITFESAVSLSFDEKHGQNPTVHYRLSYALL